MAGDPAGAPGSARVHAAGRGLAGRPGPVAVAGSRVFLAHHASAHAPGRCRRPPGRRTAATRGSGRSDRDRALGERFNAMLDALAESDSVRRTLLAGLPHDLKGPLSCMWLRIELADDSKLKDGLRADLRTCSTWSTSSSASCAAPIRRLTGMRPWRCRTGWASACAPGRARVPTSGCTAPRIRPWWCRRTPWRWAACWTT